jgi:hypothetical protein
MGLHSGTLCQSSEGHHGPTNKQRTVRKQIIAFPEVELSVRTVYIDASIGSHVPGTGDSDWLFLKCFLTVLPSFKGPRSSRTVGATKSGLKILEVSQLFSLSLIRSISLDIPVSNEMYFL